jgi:predicted DsbA family dithiol-disulfide isomerase
VRLRQLLESFPGKFSLVHRSFVLRPEVNEAATFAEYHLQHRTRAKQMTGLPYSLPEVGAPYPSSSWPALFASKWIAREHPDKFECFDAALFRAFFERAENIGDAEVLKRLAESCDIDPVAIDKALSDESIKQAVRSDHNQAQQMGIHGIPAVIIGDKVISGAVPLEDYVAAAQRVL